MAKTCSRMFRLYLTVSCWITLGGIWLSILSACAKVQTPAPTSLPAPEQLPTAGVTLLAPREIKTPTPKPTEGSAQQEATAVNLRGQLVQFWYVSEVGGEDLVPGLVETFNKTNRWGIRVEAVPYAGSGVLEEALLRSLEGKKLPNVLAGYSHDLRYWNSTGIMIVDLQPFIDDPAWGMASADQQDFYPVVWMQDAETQAEKDMPQRFGLPWYRTGFVLLYNRSWANALGFESPPVIPSQFRQQACAAARFNQEDDLKTNDSTGGWLIEPEPSLLLSWIFAFGGQVRNTAGAGYQFRSAESIDALTFIHELTSAGCAWYQPELEKYQSFADRQALFISATLQGLNDLQSVMKDAGNDDDWTVLPFPSRRGGAFDIFGPSLAIVDSTPTKQLASWLFIRWLVLPENQARWNLATATLPTRASVLPLLRGKPGASDQWERALGLLPYAYIEPVDPTWRTIRWALGDVMLQLISAGFEGSQISATLQALDRLAQEVQAVGK